MKKMKRILAAALAVCLLSAPVAEAQSVDNPPATEGLSPTPTNPDDVLEDNANPGDSGTTTPSGGTDKTLDPNTKWDWSKIIKIGADTDADQYKVLTIGGAQALNYVAVTKDGRLLFPKDGIAEEIKASLSRVQDQNTIPLAVKSVAKSGTKGRVASMRLELPEALSGEDAGLYYVAAKLPKKSEEAVYGYAVLNPKTPAPVKNLTVRVYASAASSLAAPVYVSPTPFSASYQVHQSRTPSSGDLVTYVTPVDALYAAAKADGTLTQIQSRPYQVDVVRPLITGVQVGDRLYASHESQTEKVWRYSVYDTDGRRKPQLRAQFADLANVENGDTVVWALTDQPFPDRLPSIPPDDPNTTTDPAPDQGSKDRQSKWTVNRLSADNRQQIAVNVSKKYFSNAKKAIVVNNLAFADALSATNISGGKYPILYTKANAIFKETLEELKRLNVNEVFVMGGTTSVGNGVRQAIKKALPGAKLTEIKGADRYVVNIASMKYVDAFPAVVITNGVDFADALTATPLAQAKGGPVLLTKPNTPKVLTDFLAKLDNTSLYLVGGTRSIPTSQENTFERLLGVRANRTAGADRYVVSASVASTYFKNAKSSILASGALFSDALVAAPVSQKLGAPILLTRSNRVAPELTKFLGETTALKEVLAIGGPRTIQESVLSLIQKASPAR